jgi:hypothetical protein
VSEPTPSSQDYPVDDQDHRRADTFAPYQGQINLVIKPRSLNHLLSPAKRLDKKAPKRIVVVRIEEVTQGAGLPATVADSGLIVKTVHTCPDGLPSKPFNQGLQAVGKRGLSRPVNAINRNDCALRKVGKAGSDVHHSC